MDDVSSRSSISALRTSARPKWTATMSGGIALEPREQEFGLEEVPRAAEKRAHTQRPISTVNGVSARALGYIAMFPASRSAHLKSASVRVVGARLGERGYASRARRSGFHMIRKCDFSPQTAVFSQTALDEVARRE